MPQNNVNIHEGDFVDFLFSEYLNAQHIVFREQLGEFPRSAFDTHQMLKFISFFIFFARQHQPVVRI